MTHDELFAAFAPQVSAPLARLQAGKRLVHYTSAENAYKIISGQQVWLRNALLMNDFSEIQHGISCLQAAWSDPAGAELRDWLDDAWPGLRAEFVELYDGHINGMQVGTFMLSLSEHDDDEDELGRLSMWRAYGGDAGVALVLNPTFALNDSDEIKAYSAPVLYKSVQDFIPFFRAWVNGLTSNAEIRQVDRDLILNSLFHAFRMFVLATKHPGFHEEKEWRVFHNPNLDDGSDWLSAHVELVGGIPQNVIKLALRDDETRGIAGVSPAGLINRVILGPSAHPVPIRQALASAMLAAGVEEPMSKIWVSNIPLRK